MIEILALAVAIALGLALFTHPWLVLLLAVGLLAGYGFASLFADVGKLVRRVWAELRRDHVAEHKRARELFERRLASPEISPEAEKGEASKSL